MSVSLVGMRRDVEASRLADADHAANDESRRSVSCSQEFLGGHLLDQEVGRQTCVAIRSGESEHHAFTLCEAE